MKAHIFETSESREIVSGATSGRYVRSGHIVYSRAGSLIAAPFDLGALTSTGPSVALTELVREGFEGGQFDVSDSGSLAYVQGHADAFRHRLVWVDRKGTVDALPTQPRAFGRPVISPNGGQVALDIREATAGVWVYDFSRGALSAFAALSQTPYGRPTPSA